MELQIGQIIGDYEVLGTLGRGGMGAVYKVRSTITQRVEALKLLLPDLTTDPDLAERFLREIRISAGLDHPNIAALRSGQRVGNQLLMVMEFVEGTTLADLMQRGRIPLDRTLDYLSQSLSALEYAHSRGIIHRDIKPSNIMITSSGQVKLMDFGVARLATDSKLTKTGLIVGSLHYMSPEQIEGKDLDSRSDLYSLGVTFYELVTGTRPFTGDSEYQIMAAHLKGKPQAPRDLDNSLPASINDLILTSMARDAAHRFGSATAMKAAIDSVRQQQPPADRAFGSAPTQTISRDFQSQFPATNPHRVQPPPQQHPRSHRTSYMLIGSLATVAILIAAAVYVPNLMHTRAKEQNAEPSQQIQTAPAKSATAPTASTSTSPEQIPAPIPAAPSAAGSNETAVSQPHSAPRPSTSQPRDPIVKPTPAAADGSPVSKRDSVPGVPPDAQPVHQPATPAVPDNSAEISALRDRKAQLDARIATVRESLDNLRQLQAQSGLSLRGDMAAAEQRVFYHMNQADASLQGNNPESAGKHLDSAETDLDKLERFLGR